MPSRDTTGRKLLHLFPSLPDPETHQCRFSTVRSGHTDRRAPIPLIRRKADKPRRSSEDLNRLPTRWRAGAPATSDLPCLLGLGHNALVVAGDRLKGSSCGFSPDGTLLAVGSGGVVGGGAHLKKHMREKTDLGGVVGVYWLWTGAFGGAGAEAEPQAEPMDAGDGLGPTDAVRLVFQEKLASELISEVKFSPGGEILAAASHDNRIYLLDVHQTPDGPELTPRCTISKHSSFIKTLDWSAGPKRPYVLQAACGAHELLSFDENGRHIPGGSVLRDTLWHTWTCTLGMPPCTLLT